MATRTQQWITELNTSIRNMSTLVYESLHTAMTAVFKQDAELANRVKEQDNIIDALEDEIRDNSIKTLALQQPMGADLRFIASVLSIAHELERMGDRSLNIANRVHLLLDEGQKSVLEVTALKQLGEAAARMLEQAINCFVSQDTKLAKSVAQMDEEVDKICESIQKNVVGVMQSDQHLVNAGIHSTIIALNLERIADQAANIADQVVYLVEGHRTREEWVAEVPPSVLKAPLEALERHAKIVNECLSLAKETLSYYIAADNDHFVQYSIKVAQKEHEADSVKRNVRGHLPKGIIMPIDKFELFAFVKEQDKVADDAQALVDWLSLVKKSIFPDLAKGVHSLLDKCMDAALLLPEMIREAMIFFRDGEEQHRTHVKRLIREIRTFEHEADALEIGLKHMIFKVTTDPILLHHQLTTVDIIGEVANHAENAADMMRAMVAQ